MDWISHWNRSIDIHTLCKAMKSKMCSVFSLHLCIFCSVRSICSFTSLNTYKIKIYYLRYHHAISMYTCIFSGCFLLSSWFLKSAKFSSFWFDASRFQFRSTYDASELNVQTDAITTGQMKSSIPYTLHENFIACHSNTVQYIRDRVGCSSMADACETQSTIYLQNSILG